jgi:hypothetical protein
VRLEAALRCRYAAGDPFYYPDRSRTSIWDPFEVISGDGDCKAFYDLISRVPPGGPVRMHPRYGDEQASFRKLLEMRDGPKDKTKLVSWSGVLGGLGCNQLVTLL